MDVMVSLSADERRALLGKCPSAQRPWLMLLLNELEERSGKVFSVPEARDEATPGEEPRGQDGTTRR
jgi:hypothetical protein